MKTTMPTTRNPEVDVDDNDHGYDEEDHDEEGDDDKDDKDEEDNEEKNTNDDELDFKKSLLFSSVENTKTEKSKKKEEGLHRVPSSQKGHA